MVQSTLSLFLILSLTPVWTLILTITVASYSAFHPSRIGKWWPASAVKEKAGMIHSISRRMRGLQVKLWDPLRTRAKPECLRDVFTTRRYTNQHLPLPSWWSLFCNIAVMFCWSVMFLVAVAVCNVCCLKGKSLRDRTASANQDGYVR